MKHVNNFLQYQVDELDEFNLRPNEYLELEDEQRRFI